MAVPVHLHVRNTGTGAPVLVFLHYFGGSSRTWEPVIDLLDARLHCVAPDLRGFGESEATETGYSIGDSADDVERALAELGAEDFILIGHSMGGKIALEMAARQPTGLKSLVLFAPSPPTPEPMSDEEREQLRSAFGSPEGCRKTLNKTIAHPLPIDLAAETIADNLRSSRPAWMAWLDGGSREDISARVGAISVPVTVIGGAEDKSITQDVLENQVKAYVPQAQIKIVPDVAHLIPLEAVDTTATIIEDAVS